MDDFPGWVWATCHLLCDVHFGGTFSSQRRVAIRARSLSRCVLHFTSGLLLVTGIVGRGAGMCFLRCFRCFLLVGSSQLSWLSWVEKDTNDIMDIMTIMMDIMDNILLILLGIWISIIKDDLRIAMTWISIGFVWLRLTWILTTRVLGHETWPNVCDGGLRRRWKQLQRRIQRILMW